MISGPRWIKPDETAYFTIHPDKNPPPQNGYWLKSVSFLKAPVSHPPLSQFNRTFHKTNRPLLHYKYRFSPDIGTRYSKVGAWNLKVWTLYRSCSGGKEKCLWGPQKPNFWKDLMQLSTKKLRWVTVSFHVSSWHGHNISQLLVAFHGTMYRASLILL